MMGIPIGWADCEPLAMDKSPHNAFWHGVICGQRPDDGDCSSDDTTQKEE